MDEFSKLVNKNYQKYTSQYEVDEYIRQLRRSLIDLKLKNDFLLKEELYIPIKVERNYPYNNDQITIDQIQEPNRNFIAITITYDHKKFPQLFITPISEQIKYIEKVFSVLLYDNDITAVYGSFERQKNGFIHGHFITPYYGNYKHLENYISTYFTNGHNGKQHAVLIKPVDDINKWLQYINKKEDFKDYLEYNIKIKTLDL